MTTEMHLLDDKKDLLLSKFDWAIRNLTNYYTMFARKEEQAAGNPDYQKIKVSEDTIRSTIEQVAGVIYQKDGKSFVSWVYPTQREGYSDQDVVRLLLIQNMNNNRTVYDVSKTPNVMRAAKDVVANTRSEWSKLLQWANIPLEDVTDARTELERMIPTTELCKKYDIPQSFERELTHTVLRRYGTGLEVNDAHYPEKTLDVVMNEFLSTKNLVAKNCLQLIPLKPFLHIGPYKVCEYGIFFEQDGFINYAAYNRKAYHITQVKGNGTQKLDYKDGALIITYYTSVHQVAWMKHSDTDGGMGEMWTDEYKADVTTERIPFDFNHPKGL